jgi:hypothetical protein
MKNTIPSAKIAGKAMMTGVTSLPHSLSSAKLLFRSVFTHRFRQPGTNTKLLVP